MSALREIRYLHGQANENLTILVRDGKTHPNTRNMVQGNHILHVCPSNKRKRYMQGVLVKDFNRMGSK